MSNKISKQEWETCQKYERSSWGDNIYLTETNGEVIKQNTYAKLLNLVENENFNYIDGKFKSILDVGCGPTSLLLRTKNSKRSVGVEPLFYSTEVNKKFTENNIELVQIPAEEMDFKKNEFDEVWMYNVLQHTYDPTLILNKIQKYGKTIKIFEWLDIPAHEGHPHCFSENYFVETLSLNNEDYKIVNLNNKYLVGKAIVVIK